MSGCCGNAGSAANSGQRHPSLGGWWYAHIGTFFASGPAGQECPGLAGHPMPDPSLQEFPACAPHFQTSRSMADERERKSMKTGDRETQPAAGSNSRAPIELPDPPCGHVGHVGATLVEALLSSKTEDTTAIETLIDRFVVAFPDSTTTSSFAAIAGEASARLLKSGIGRREADTISDMVHLLVSHNVETVAQLSAWIDTPANLDRLKAIQGVEEKTVDRLRILASLQNLLVH